MNHILQTIYTAQYRYSGLDRVDITVKGQDPDWKAFAPTWSMVMGVKNHTMSEVEYTELYNRDLIKVPTHIWDRLLQMKEATFVCFCPQNAFCHRNILVNYIINALGNRIVYGGWRN